MKKNIILLTLLTLYFFKGYGQLFTLPFTGAATCPTPGSTLSPQPSNVTIGTVTRYGTLTCNSTADCYNTANWTTQTTINTTQYIEFTVTAAIGYQVNFASINFITQRSSTGPVNGRIAHDGGTGTFSSSYDFTATTSNTAVSWDFTDFTANAGSTVKFRIYGWGASGSTGTLRLDDLTLNATINTTGGTLNWLLLGNAGINRSTNFIGTIDTQSVAIRTNNVERVVIDKSGKVGIGTTVPDSTLTVVGGLRLDMQTKGAGKVLTSDANGGATWQSTPNYSATYIPFTGTGQNNSVSGQINFTNGTRDVVSINSNGGIGNVDVYNSGSGNLSGSLRPNAVLFKNVLNNTYNSILSTDSLGFTIYTDSNYSHGLSGSFYYGAKYDSLSYVQKKYVDSVVAKGIGSSQWTTTNNNIYFAKNVGIGTTYINDTSYQLFVEKGIRTRKIKVDQISAAWPDYVFEDNYSLPTLFEVENFLKKNKHLAGVPTANDVKKEGIDLGYNQSILLLKIEELTLYIIEQNKKTTDQQAQLLQQKSIATEQQERISSLQQQIDELKLLIKNTKK
jgi:hypothetical protein